MDCDSVSISVTRKKLSPKQETVPSALAPDPMETKPDKLIPLALLPEGATAIIVDLAAGRGLARRLAELGFNTGTEVQLLKSRPPGPVLIGVKDSRIAIGRGVAMKILVTLVNP
jgi:ferrous iron transport protein A